jgi:hypothetical protein
VDDLTPKWAVELMIRFEKLDSKISAAEERNSLHSEWATRSIKDFEMRLRALEQFRWLSVGIALAVSTLITVIAKLVA